MVRSHYQISMLGKVGRWERALGAAAFISVREENKRVGAGGCGRPNCRVNSPDSYGMVINGNQR